MIHRFALALALSAMAACAPQPVIDRAETSISTLPPMKMFASPTVTRPTRSNASIAADFLDLSFLLESGRPLPVFTRFEGPITIRVRGATPPSMLPDLDRLITRFRREAGIDIRRVTPSSPASITVETIPRAELQRAVPQAACFVVPRVTGWADFKRNRRSAVTDWKTLRVREKMAIFIPNDVAPQEIRDCLHEEVAQALGPLNDMYHLTDSVFNDDNFHTVLTGFDMLILRTTYARELHSGMDRATVAARLPGILRRLNPAGANRATPSRPPTSRAWIDTIEQALGPRAGLSQRHAAAKRAVTLARAANWNDNRLAFSLFALGRLSLGRDPELALASFLQAGAIYGADPDTQVHAAHIAMQLAAFALSSGQAGAALEIVDRYVVAVTRAENAALLATLLMVKAEAQDLLGQTGPAATTRRDSLGWARYGFGPDAEVRKRASEITALNPRRRAGATTGDAI
ncbi:DUF2927 domain-containing protein [Oceaniglobus ichthyenteri]|uniref:DUF2927 domain-containing protein n=1 Tax=Oceaniglobus ichthyenteri TaxID=2136177 RepID=UPI000D371BC8|nr:DUF2927 domain-containing protein [Oceaniglobus ichthyenteri]